MYSSLKFGTILSRGWQFFHLLNSVTSRSPVRPVNITKFFCSVPRHGKTLFEVVAKTPNKRNQSPCYRSLAQKLQDEGNKSVYLERIRRSVDVEQDLQSLETEMLQEISIALRKQADKTNWAFFQLEQVQNQLHSLNNHLLHDGNLVREFNKLRDVADQERKKLLIHRQACGFRTGNLRVIEQLYPLPPKLPEPLK